MTTDLSAILALYPAVARPCDAPEPLGNAGGLSGSRLWRFRSGIGPLVARAWPSPGPPRANAEVIHGWLAEAGRLGFVPVPLRGRDGRTLYERSGRLWDLSPWMPGEAVTSRPATKGLVRAAFEALAAFHQRLSRSRLTGYSPGLLSRLRELQALRDGGFDETDRLLAGRDDDPVTALARDWVEVARAATPRVVDALTRAAGSEVVRQPCLRDVRPDHFLFTGDRLTGLIDFGAMGLDAVAGDLGRLASEWFGRDPALREAALDAYSAVRPLDPAETALVEVFERSSAVLGGGHWVRWHFAEGRAFDDPDAVARGLAKGLERIRSIP